MRALRAAFLLLTVAALGAAEDRSEGPRVEAIVPVPPTEHQRLHYFGRRHHHLVPGTVTINRAAYVCDLDGKSFRDEDIAYAQQLAKAGIPVELHVYPGAPHGFERFAPHSGLSQRAMAERTRVLRAL